jgi:syntaxin 5
LKSKKDRKDQFGNGNDGASSNFLAFRSSTPPAKSSPSTSSSASPLKQRPIDPTFTNTTTTANTTSSVFAQAPVSHIDSSNLDSGKDYKKYDDQSHVAIDFSQQQQSLMMEQEPLLGTDSRNLRARNNALGAIESTINELGTIYQQLAHLVAEQGETVQRIDFNIEDMNMNVLSGQNQLARYLRRVNSNRFLIAKMFIAFIIFIIVFKFLFL